MLELVQLEQVVLVPLGLLALMPLGQMYLVEVQLTVVVMVAEPYLDQSLHVLGIVFVGKLHRLIWLPFETIRQENHLSFPWSWRTSYAHPSFFQTLIACDHRRHHLDDVFSISCHVVTLIYDASSLDTFETWILCSM